MQVAAERVGIYGGEEWLVESTVKMTSHRDTQEQKA